MSWGKLSFLFPQDWKDTYMDYSKLRGGTFRDSKGRKIRVKAKRNPEFERAMRKKRAQLADREFGTSPESDSKMRYLGTLTVEDYLAIKKLDPEFAENTPEGKKKTREFFKEFPQFKAPDKI